MIVLTAKYYLNDPADLDAIVVAFTEMAARVAADEPGCALYHASRSTERDDLVLLYEHYIDEAALTGHRETPHFKQIIEGRIVPLLANRERELYELLVLMRLLPFATDVPGVGRRVHLGTQVASATAGAGDTDGEIVVDLTAATLGRCASEDLPTSAAGRVASALVPTDLGAFVENGQRGLDEARDALAWWAAAGDEYGPSGQRLAYPLTEVVRLPAVPEPSLIRDFMAFEQHLLNIFPKLGREIPSVWYEIPVYYKGNPGAVGAHLDPIEIPAYADGELDFEFEIAAVIGQGGRDIAAEDALAHVYGYTIYDDFSARAIQTREMTVGLGPAKGKDFDRAHVLGPLLVTADEIPDPYALAMHATVSGEPWTSGSTGAMHWKFEQMIEHASRAETLRPLEVFGSGTVGGGSAAEVGRMLHAGDVVELTVERIGTLTNTLVTSERAAST